MGCDAIREGEKRDVTYTKYLYGDKTTICNICTLSPYQPQVLDDFEYIGNQYYE